MSVEELKKWLIDFRGNPNYQYRNLTQDEFDDLAKKSFERIPDDYKHKIFRECGKFGLKEKEGILLVLRARFLAQTNLFALCHLLVKYNKTTARTHEPICNSFFVSKDPANFKTFEEFAKDYTSLKERLLLVPRGGYKSSINLADVVQYLICWPETTLLILTGVYGLAKGFVGELSSHFVLEEVGKDTKGKPVYGPKKIEGDKRSIFQALFAEHMITPNESRDTEFQDPASLMRDKEPSVMAASIEQNLSGWHFGVMKLDDVVTNENSLTITRLEAVNKQVEVNRPMLNPFGFFDLVGTWYDECLVGDTLITMSDWTQKPIKDIQVGDEVIGWNHPFKGKRTDKNAYVNGRACFTKTKVTHIGSHESRPVNKYSFKSGRDIISTGDHNWFNRKCNYSHIGLGYHEQKYIRRMFIPTEKKKEYDWFSGIYDGEGSFQKQRNGYPSGSITLSQTLKNPTVVEMIRTRLSEAKFNYREDWTYFENSKLHDKCNFVIEGGWKERYRFLIEVAPTRFKKIADSLCSQIQTWEDELVLVTPQEEQKVYYFGTETGNYLADGCLSKNSDVYGLSIKKEEEFAKDMNLQHEVEGSVWDGVFNSNVTMKIYLRSAWIPTLEAKKMGMIEEEMKETDYILWFPESLSYKTLLQKKKKNAESFAISYENNPRKVHQVKFPRELLIRRTLPATQLPQTGLIVSAVDTAYSTKSWADYTVMITALIFGGRFYIIDCLRGKFNEYELPKVIAAAGYKWKPKRIAVEDSLGVKWFGRELRREMDILQISIPVEYVSLGLGTKAKSKELKAKPVVRLLGDERMFFANTCSGLDDIYKELENFGTASGTHDDVVSALSVLVDQFGGYADMDSRINQIDTAFVADQKSKLRHDLIYGLGQFSRFNRSDYQESDHPKTNFEIETQETGERDIDPFQEAGLFN
jgi:phage terminase large subunit-like protein